MGNVSASSYCSFKVDDWLWKLKQDIPCILEVDLEYPKELHNLHDDYPLAAEMLMTNNVEKLVPNLNDKEKEVLHHKMLKLYGWYIPSALM